MSEHEAVVSHAFTRGRRDAHSGIASNPFPDGTAEAEQWRQGHQSAANDERECITETKRCPLAKGECAQSCYLRDCNPQNMPYSDDPMTLAKEASL